MSLFTQAAEVAVKAAVPPAVAIATAPAAVNFMGAPMSCFGYAVLGAVFSYAWGDRESSHAVALFKIGAVVFFSVAVSVFIPDWADWDIDPNSQPGLSLVVAMFARWIIPALRKAIPTAARGFADTVARTLGSRDRNNSYDTFPPPGDSGDLPPMQKPPQDNSDEPGY